MMLAIVGSFAFLYSCGDDDEDPSAAPTVSVSAAITGGSALSDGGDVEAGSSVDFTVSVTAEGGFNVLRLANGVTAEFPRTDTDNVTLGTDGTTATVTFQVTTESGDAGNSVTIDFTAVDDEDQTGTGSFSFNIVAPASPDVVTHTETLLGGQLNPNESSFYNAVDDASYGYADMRDNNSANTDFAFFYGTTNMYTIAALDDSDAGIAFEAAIGADALSATVIATRNQTRFKPTDLTSTEFEAIATEADLLNAYGEVAAGDTKVNGLEAGDVFAFVLDDDRAGKVGLVEVVATGGTSGADRTITIQVKIQPDSN